MFFGKMYHEIDRLNAQVAHHENIIEMRQIIARELG